MLKKQIKLLIITTLFLTGGARAVPIKVSDHEMQLAMLDLIKDFQKGNTHNKSIRKTVVNKPKQKPLVLPSNCMTWTAQQINSRAKKFTPIIVKYSRKYKLDSNLVKSVITAESCFKTKALSTANAKGLMQLIPATAKRFGVKNSYNPEQNIKAGTQYLRFLLDRYQGDLKKSIAAYNAGEGNVDKYKGIPPFKETKQYVKNVLKTYKLLTPPKVKSRVKAVYYPIKKGQKPGRHGWQYNRRLAPHLYKKLNK